MHTYLILCLALAVSFANGWQLLPTNSLGVTAKCSSFYGLDSSPESLLTGTGPWNSGRGGPGWIEINLGSPYSLSELILTTTQTRTFVTSHTVYAGLTSSSVVPVATFSGTTTNEQKLTKNFDNLKAQFIKIVTTETNDWVAWLKISLRGEPANNVVQVLPTESLAVSGRCSSFSGKSTLDNLITGAGDWNSGGYAPGWVEINLGAPYFLSNLSLTCDQMLIGQTSHTVYGSLFGGKPFILATFSGVTKDMQVLSKTFYESVRVQYIKVETTESGDWVAWKNLALSGVVDSHDF